MPQNVTPFGFGWQTQYPISPLPLSPRWLPPASGWNPYVTMAPPQKYYGSGDLVDMRNEFAARPPNYSHYSPFMPPTYGGGTSGRITYLPPAQNTYYPMPLARSFGLLIDPRVRRG